MAKTEETNQIKRLSSYDGMVFEVMPSGILKITANEWRRSDFSLLLEEKGPEAALDHLLSHALEAKLGAAVTSTGNLALRELKKGDDPFDLISFEGGRVWVFIETRHVDPVARLAETGVVRFSQAEPGIELQMESHETEPPPFR